MRKAVTAWDVGGDGRGIERGRGREPALERGREGDRLGEIGGEPAVESVPERRGMGGAQAIPLEASLEFGKGKIVQRQSGDL